MKYLSLCVVQYVICADVEHIFLQILVHISALKRILKLSTIFKLNKEEMKPVVTASDKRLLI